MTADPGSDGGDEFLRLTPVAAVSETRPTLTDEMVEAFEADRERYARS